MSINRNMSWDKEVAATSLLDCVVVAVLTDQAWNFRLLCHCQAPEAQRPGVSLSHHCCRSWSASPQCLMRLMDWIFGVWQWEPQFLQC